MGFVIRETYITVVAIEINDVHPVLATLLVVPLEYNKQILFGKLESVLVRCLWRMKVVNGSQHLNIKKKVFARIYKQFYIAPAQVLAYFSAQ